MCVCNGTGQRENPHVHITLLAKDKNTDNADQGTGNSPYGETATIQGTTGRNNMNTIKQWLTKHGLNQRA